MLKLFFKLKKKLKEKGFTLVELLAVIVILAIIMLIAIPGVLSVLESARLKTFTEYVDKSAGLAQKQIAEDQMNGSMASQCVIYNIKTDLGLDTTGSFEGWVLVDSNNNNIYITLFNDDYGLAAYHYNDPSLKVGDYMKKKSAFTDEELSIDYLCGNSTCATCAYKDEDGSKIIDNEEFIKRNSAVLVTGGSFNSKIRSLYSASDNFNTSFTNVTSLVKSDTLNEEANKVDISDSSSGYRVWAWAEGDTVYYYSDTPYRIYLNVDCGSMFRKWSKIKTIDFNYLKSPILEYVSYMFTGCSDLESLDLSSLKTSNVKDMTSMFSSCNKLSSLDLSNFDTSKVEDFSSMFGYCSSLVKLDLSSFNTSNCKKMWRMFYYCSKLEEVDLSSFDTSKVTSMQGLFFDCHALKKLDLSNFDTGRVKVMLCMFSGCNSLSELNISSFNTSSATDISRMFESCYNLTSLDLSHFNTSNVTNMYAMFSNCYKLSSLDVSNFDTSKVTNMVLMFSSCTKLTSLDLSSFYTPMLSNMTRIFEHCTSLVSLDISHFKTTNVTIMDSAFSFCSSLTVLDISSFDTSNVYDMRALFANCEKLEIIYVSNKWDISAVSMSNNMFTGSGKLPNFDGTSDSSKAYAGDGGYLTLKA